MWWLVVSVYTVLIETLWNVNNGEGLDVFTPADVLIETLWNVNIIAAEAGTPSGLVLIETLWNVNNVGYHMDYREEQGINRNIVECKFV